MLLLGVAVALVAGLALSAVDTVIAVLEPHHRLLCGRHRQPGGLVCPLPPGVEHHSGQRRRGLAVPDADLPVYTVLVPAYREPEVIGRLVTNLEHLEYPRSKLDIKFLLEADDEETIAALRDQPAGSAHGSGARPARRAREPSRRPSISG